MIILENTTGIMVSKMLKISIWKLRYGVHIRRQTIFASAYGTYVFNALACITATRVEFLQESKSIINFNNVKTKKGRFIADDDSTFPYLFLTTGSSLPFSFAVFPGPQNRAANKSFKNI